MPGTELDTIADLLRRWQRVEGPMDRVRVVTDATEALRKLSSVDTRVLAQGLWEHGAGPAAEQVAHRTGTSVAPEELAEVAQGVLSLDHREVEQLAGELRDPEQRRRLLTASGVPEEEVRHHLPERPPASDRRFDLPPPPGADDAIATHDRPDRSSDLEGAATWEETARSAGRSAGAGNVEVAATPEEAAPSGQAGDVEVAATPGVGNGSTEADEAGVADTAEDSVPVRDDAGRSTGVGARPAGGPYGSSTVAPRSSLEASTGLVGALRDASNGRERLQHLEAAPAIVQGDQLLQLLRAVPDGWQRRTVLRKLLTEDRVHDLTDPVSTVAAFDRAGDRFAAAALLVRSGVSDLAAVLPALEPRDAARLQRRVQS